MGKISKGARCSVKECEKEAFRSLHSEKVTAAGLTVQAAQRAFLCKKHYREFKKATRKEKLVEKWRYGSLKA